MKKLILVAVAAVMIFGSCNKSSAPSPSLKTELDTISYELGTLNSKGVKMYLAERAGVDTTYMDEFYKGVMEGANSSENKKKLAYNMGVQIGMQIGTQMVQSINGQIFGEDSTQTISLRNFLSGWIAAAEGKAVIDAKTVEGEIQQRMTSFRQKSMMKTYGKNKEAGEKFLAENLKKEGVKELTPGGVQYKILKEGNGPIPADTSRVMVSYEGKTIDGKVFDSSYKNNDNKPIQIMVAQMIQGWKDVLTHMPVGSTWEIYIPQELAYGDQPSSVIEPFSALIFKLELVRICGDKE